MLIFVVFIDSTKSPKIGTQVEMHPMWRQGRLRKTCGDHKIHVSAYSPLGGPGNAWGSTAVVNHPIIRSIAFKHKATPAQVKLNSKALFIKNNDVKLKSDM